MSLRFPLLAAGAMLAFACTVNAATPAATAPTKTLSSSQQQMVDCNKQATGKKGADRKTFMSTCLKGGSAAAAPAAAAPTAKQTQQEKMKSCNVDAKSKALTGDARKSFMSNCLKASPAATP